MAYTGLLSSVGSHVIPKCRSVRTPNVTYVTTVRFSASMSPHMHLKCAPFTKPCVTHITHLKSFSPEWVRMCFLRQPLWLNCLRHTSQLNGFSPVWVRFCTVRWVRHCKLHATYVTNVRFLQSMSCQICLQMVTTTKLQMAPGNVFTPEWIFKWRARFSLGLVSFMPHTSQLNNVLSPAYDR